MHTVPMPVLVGVSALVLMGCDRQSTESENNASSQQQSTSAEDVAREASQAAEAAGKYVQEQIQAYRTDAQQGLQTIDASIKALGQRAENLTGEARIETNRAMEDLVQRRDAFVKKLEETSADSRQAWNDVRAGLDKAWADLESAAKSAVDRFGAAAPNTDPGDGG